MIEKDKFDNSCKSSPVGQLVSTFLTVTHQKREGEVKGTSSERKAKFDGQNPKKLESRETNFIREKLKEYEMTLGRQLAIWLQGGVIFYVLSHSLLGKFSAQILKIRKKTSRSERKIGTNSKTTKGSMGLEVWLASVGSLQRLRL